MTELPVLFFLWLLGTSVLAWIVPRQLQVDCIGVSTCGFLMIVAPWSMVWLLLGSLVVFISCRMAPGRRSVALISVILLFSMVFLGMRGAAPLLGKKGIFIPAMVGMAYYTCRHIHVLLEVYIGRMTTLPLHSYLRYQFFLPVIMAGPIHRYQHFIRQCERRRWEWTNLTGGLERILYGYSFIILGNYLLNIKLAPFFNHWNGDGFIGQLLLSARHWLYLYSQFGGYTDVALGFSLLLGFQIEENFNSPLMAVNLIDFWQRWHITLSSWCKDYVFKPVQAKTRNQLMAVFFAMIAMGMWHGVSFYYLLWGMYHALGISLCRSYQLSSDPLRLGAMPAVVRRTITRTATFLWLVAGMPVLGSILSFSHGQIL